MLFLRIDTVFFRFRKFGGQFLQMFFCDGYFRCTDFIHAGKRIFVGAQALKEVLVPVHLRLCRLECGKVRTRHGIKKHFGLRGVLYACTQFVHLMIEFLRICLQDLNLFGKIRRFLAESCHLAVSRENTGAFIFNGAACHGTADVHDLPVECDKTYFMSECLRGLYRVLQCIEYDGTKQEVFHNGTKTVVTGHQLVRTGNIAGQPSGTSYFIRFGVRANGTHG